MIDLHATAILGLLTAAITTPRKVFDGKVDPPVTDLRATPYVLARFAEAPPTLNFRGVRHVYAVRTTLHCVGANEKAARQVADLVDAALMDVTPTVAGRKCFKIRWDDSSEQAPNEATGVSVHSQVRVYLLQSVPS